METNKNQKPASDRIRFALWRASRKAGCPTDYRGMNLTQQEAVELLEKFNKETGYNNGREYKHSDKFLKEQTQEEMYKAKFIEFFKEKYLDKVLANLNSVLNQVSEIYNADIFGNDLGGKRYKFYGSGCAVAWLEFRKCKKYELINSVCRKAYNNECIQMVYDQVDRGLINRLESEGCPLGAILGQDYSFRQLEMQAISDFLEMNGAKNVRIKVHYD